MRLGFTGTQMGMSDEQQEQLYLWLKGHLDQIDYAYHGGCVGADEQFDTMMRKLKMGFWITIYPSNIFHKQMDLSQKRIGHPPLPPLIRNKIIVSLSNILLVTPAGTTEIVKSGTWSTVRAMRSLKRRIVIFYPDGRVVYEGGDGTVKAIA